MIASAFRRDGAERVEVVGSGSDALRALDAEPPEIIILDLNLPDIDGFTLCRMLRARRASHLLAVIVVTARCSEADRVRAFELGADDYVTKPFGLRELTARAKAVMRRTLSEPIGESVYEGLLLTADFAAVDIRVEGRPIDLTRREFQILRCLVENRHRVMSRDRLLDRIWGIAAPVEARTVDVHLGRLRAKLGAAGGQIQTVFGLGYQFVEDPGSGADQ